MARKSRVINPPAPVVTTQLEIRLASLPGTSAGGGTPRPPAGNYFSFIEPESLRVCSTPMCRSRPVARIISQHQNCPTQARLPDHKPLNTLDVLHHVVGPNVLRPLAQQPETLAIHLTHPRSRQVLQLQRQVVAGIRPRHEQVQSHPRRGPGFQPDPNRRVGQMNRPSQRMLEIRFRMEHRPSLAQHSQPPWDVGPLFHGSQPTRSGRRSRGMHSSAAMRCVKHRASAVGRLAGARALHQVKARSRSQR